MNANSAPATRASPEQLRASERRILVRVLMLALPLAVVVLTLLPNAGPVLRLYDVPASSMAPALPIGSQFIVSRASYGYSRHSFDVLPLPIAGRWPEGRAPARGDIAVFRLPRNRKVHYVKRVIGLPGDEVALRKGVLFINGAEVSRRRVGDVALSDAISNARPVPAYEETLPEGRKHIVLDTDPNGPFDTVGPFKVPAGHYFVLGDNRDNSADSRMAAQVGFVPLDLFVGKVVLTFGGGS